MEILAAAAFEICSTTNRQKGYSLGQLIFVRDMIIPIKHRVDWELIHHWKQTQINRDNARENKHRVDYEYKVGDNVILTDHTAYKYETPYKGPFVIKQCFTNKTVILKYGAIQIRYNICPIKPYKYNTKVEDFNPKNMDKPSTYEQPVVYFYIKLKFGIKYMIGYTRQNLTLMHIVCVSEVYMTKYFLQNGCTFE